MEVFPKFKWCFFNLIFSVFFVFFLEKKNENQSCSKCSCFSYFSKQKTSTKWVIISNFAQILGHVFVINKISLIFIWGLASIVLSIAKLVHVQLKNVKVMNLIKI